MALLRQITALVAGTLLVAVPLLVASSPTDGQNLEYQVKAAFLFNFLKFIEWPSPPAAADAWVFCIAQPDPFGDVLDGTVRGKSVEGHPVRVQRFTRLSEIHACHILFVSRPAQAKLGVPILPGVLTVGENPGFVNDGGVLRFYLEDGKVRFEISADAARAAGLRVSAQLLRVGGSR